MLNVIGCSLREIIELKGIPFKEAELWSLIEAFYNYVTQLKANS